MKNPNRVRRESTTAAVKEQSPNGTASSWAYVPPLSEDEAVTPYGQERYSCQREFQLPLNGFALMGINPRMQLEFICQTLARHKTHLYHSVFPRMADREVAGQIAECICVSEAVIEWLASGTGGKLTLPLPGLARFSALDEESILDAIAIMLELNNEKLTALFCWLTPLANLELLEALAIAERVSAEHNSNTEYGEGPFHNKQTRLIRLARKARAEVMLGGCASEAA